MQETGRPPLLAFSAILLLVALTLRPHFDLTGGDFPFYLQAKSFAAFRADIPIPPGTTELPTMMAEKDGRYFAQYPPGIALALVPFYWIGHALDVVTGNLLGKATIGSWREGHLAIVAVTLANLVFLAAILGLLWWIGGSLGVSPETGRRAAWLTVFAAPFWYLAGHPNTHFPSTMLTLAATAFAFAARARGSWQLAAVAGLAGALSLLVRPMNVVVVTPLGVYLLARHSRPLAAASAFSAVSLAGPLLIGLLNQAMFGSPFETAYQHSLEFGESGRQQAILTGPTAGFTTPLAEGLTGMTIGAVAGARREDGAREHRMVLPGPATPWKHVRGLFFLMPALLFAVPGFRRWWHEGRGAESAVLAAQLVLLLLVYSKWFFWYANPHTPLPSRFLCDAYPGWCLAIAAYAEQASSGPRAWLRFAIAWTVGNQTLVVLSVYLRFLAGVDPVGVSAARIIVLLAVVGFAAAWAGRRARPRPLEPLRITP